VRVRNYIPVQHIKGDLYTAIQDDERLSIYPQKRDTMRETMQTSGRLRHSLDAGAKRPMHKMRSYHRRHSVWCAQMRKMQTLLLQYAMRATKKSGQTRGPPISSTRDHNRGKLSAAARLPGRAALFFGPSSRPPLALFASSPAMVYLAGNRSLSARSRLYARLFLMGVGGSPSQTIGYPHDIGC